MLSVDPFCLDVPQTKQLDFIPGDTGRNESLAYLGQNYGDFLEWSVLRSKYDQSLQDTVHEHASPHTEMAGFQSQG